VPWQGEWERQDELARAIQQGETPLVLDVRAPDEYAAGHVRGAINIPVEELAQRLATLPRGRPVVTY
jgi:rhodanese-related sulfurtransferase